MAFPWPSTDPASIAMLFESGAGPESLIAAAAAWATQAGMHELSAGLSALNIASLAPSFVGVGGVASAATGGLLNILAGTMGGHCLKQQAIVLAAIEAYMATRMSLIPSAVVHANRSETEFDVGINPLVFGTLTPRIAELQGEYGSFWAQNAGLGTTYGTALNTLTSALLTAPPPATLGANPAAPAVMGSSLAGTAAEKGASTAARAATEVAGQGGGFEQVLSSATQGMGSVLQPFMGMFSSVPQSLQGLMSLPQSMFGSLGSMFGGMNPANAALGAGGIHEAGRVTPGLPAGVAAGGGGGGAGVPGGIGGPGAGPGLTSYTRPTGAFEPEGGRATGLRSGLLNAAEVRSPTMAGGGGVPMSPAAGMLGRGQGEEDKREVAHARIVLDGVRTPDDQSRV